MTVRRDSIDHFFHHDYLLDKRVILVADSNEDGVDDQMANRFLKAITILEHANHDPITIMLKSQGGCIFNGAAIYDAIALSPCHVTIKVYGCAMSMGSTILQAGDERIMTPSSVLMMHDGTFGHEDTPLSFENWAVACKKLRQEMYKIFASRTGKTVRYWEKKCQSDYILTPAEALKEGLIDRIAEPTA